MRLFEVATEEMWQAANKRHLDVNQALHYLSEGLDLIVRVKFSGSADARKAKRKVIYEYASRMGLSVQTVYRDGWIFIKNVSVQRAVSQSGTKLAIQ